MVSNPATCRIAVLCGGTSGEREISLASGEGARAALVEAGFVVDVLDPAEKSALKQLIETPYDVAFLATHGKGGEDGALQGFLETIGLPYTGSGVCASAVALDKSKTKILYKDAGLATPPGFVVDGRYRPTAEEIVAELGPHCVVKPATEGSSLGVYIVEGPSSIEKAIDEALEIDSTVIVERQIFGRELTVAVIGNDHPQALPAIEIVPINDFYDFESKYAPGGSVHICPAEVDDATAESLADLAIKAHQVLGCAGFSRTDFMLDEEGVLWIIETNTLPGMTATSLVPDAARAAGMKFSELCHQLVDWALERAV